MWSSIMLHSTAPKASWMQCNQGKVSQMRQHVFIWFYLFEWEKKLNTNKNILRALNFGRFFTSSAQMFSVHMFVLSNDVTVSLHNKELQKKTFSPSLENCVNSCQNMFLLRYFCVQLWMNGKSMSIAVVLKYHKPSPNAWEANFWIYENFSILFKWDHFIGSVANHHKKKCILSKQLFAIFVVFKYYALFVAWKTMNCCWKSCKNFFFCVSYNLNKIKCIHNR